MATINGMDTAETISGTAGADTVYARGGDDTVLALEGNDTLYGEAGNDSIDASLGNDLIYGGLGHDDINANAGDDRAYGGEGGDDLQGRAGNDRLYGEADNDTLAGGLGNDTLAGGAGNDRLSDMIDDPSGRDGDDRHDGGEGVDGLFYSQEGYGGGPTGVTANLAAGTARQGTERDTLVSVENLDGTDHADAITGSGGANQLLGYGGNDTLTGAAGNDYLNGGSGSDTVRGGGGADRLTGGNDDLVAVDVLDFGADTSRDIGYFFTVDFEGGNGREDSGKDTVVNFDPARDRLHFQIASDVEPDAAVDVRDFLDSDDNGRIDARDVEVERVGDDLVLDIEAVADRAGLGFLDNARVTIRGGGFSAQAVDFSGPGGGGELITEDGIG